MDMIKNSNKILYCATVDYHFKAFHIPYMKWFREQGWEVHIAASGNIPLPNCDIKYNIPIERSPFKIKNIKAYREIKTIINKNNYDIIHVHTPMAGVLVRLAAISARKRGTKIIYTAHGFHFYKGAPFVNWLVYYPIERWLSRYTDSLITINSEDYNRAVKHKFEAKKIYHVHGVGVDALRFSQVNDEEKAKLRDSYGYNNEDFILCYAAELNKNKNQKMLLEVVSKAKNKVPNIKLLLLGEGILLDYYKKLAQKLNIEENVDFLGHRDDVVELVKLSDIAVGSSLREGLPVNILEAMACGKPIVVSDNRGHRELVKNSYNGFIVDCHDEKEFAERLCKLYYSKWLRSYLGKNSVTEFKKYALSDVMSELINVYRQAITSEGDVNAVSNKGFTYSG
jgi:glycosyltransferase EpsD